MEKKYVYVIQFDCSTTDCECTELFVYATYDKAYDKFKELINGQIKEEHSWISEIKWDDEGEPIGPYEFECEDNNSDESEVYWHLTDANDWYRHLFIDLLVKEIIQ